MTHNDQVNVERHICPDSSKRFHWVTSAGSIYIYVNGGTEEKPKLLTAPGTEVQGSYVRFQLRLGDDYYIKGRDRRRKARKYRILRLHNSIVFVLQATDKKQQEQVKRAMDLLMLIKQKLEPAGTKGDVMTREEFDRIQTWPELWRKANPNAVGKLSKEGVLELLHLTENCSTTKDYKNIPSTLWDMKEEVSSKKK